MYTEEGGTVMYTGERGQLSIQGKRVYHLYRENLNLTYTEETEPLCIQEKGVVLRIQGKLFRGYVTYTGEDRSVTYTGDTVTYTEETKPSRIQGKTTRQQLSPN